MTAGKINQVSNSVRVPWMCASFSFSDVRICFCLFTPIVAELVPTRQRKVDELARISNLKTTTPATGYIKWCGCAWCV